MESKKKVALITGITGQDGSYLTELLLKRKIMKSMELSEGLAILIPKELTISTKTLIILILY